MILLLEYLKCREAIIVCDSQDISIIWRSPDSNDIVNKIGNTTNKSLTAILMYYDN